MKKAITFLSICLFMMAGTQTANAQQTRKFRESFTIFQLDKGSNESYSVLAGDITFDATFTGFAERVSVKNVQLYVTNASDDIMNAIEQQGISREFYEDVSGFFGYKIPHFTLYMVGCLITIGDVYSTKYSDNSFHLQVSDDLGDFITPEFSDLDKDKYSGSNSWENTGDIRGFQVSEIYFKDYDIRVKNE